MALTKTVLFRDDFNTLDTVNSWVTILGTGYPGGPQDGFGTQEIETMTANRENIWIEDGKLNIAPTRDSSGKWFSSRLESRKVFKPDAGQKLTISSSLSLPNVHGAEANGYWPAFWALGSSNRDNPYTWPACGEFDFMESVNGIPKTWQTLHGGYAAQWGGPLNEPSGRGNGGLNTNPDPWGTFHKYSFTWDRTELNAWDSLRWYVDDVLTLTINENEVPADVWATMTEHHGYFLIFNVAIDGQFVRALGGAATPQTKPGVPMSVDWVEVAVEGDSVVPTPIPTPTPTPTPVPTEPVDPNKVRIDKRYTDGVASLDNWYDKALAAIDAEYGRLLHNLYNDRDRDYQQYKI